MLISISGLLGDRLDEVITNHIRSKHGLLIGDTTAEEVKKQNWSGSIQMQIMVKMDIRGRSVYDGLPQKVTIFLKLKFVVH